MRSSALFLALAACHVPWAVPIEPHHASDSEGDTSETPAPAPTPPAPRTLTLRSDCATPVILEVAGQKVAVAHDAASSASYLTGTIVLDGPDGAAIASVEAAKTGVVVGPDCRSLSAN